MTTIGNSGRDNTIEQDSFSITRPWRSFLQSPDTNGQTLENQEAITRSEFILPNYNKMMEIIPFLSMPRPQYNTQHAILGQFIGIFILILIVTKISYKGRNIVKMDVNYVVFHGFSLPSPFNGKYQLISYLMVNVNRNDTFLNNYCQRHAHCEHSNHYSLFSDLLKVGILQGIDIPTPICNNLIALLKEPKCDTDVDQN